MRGERRVIQDVVRRVVDLKQLPDPPQEGLVHGAGLADVDITLIRVLVSTAPWKYSGAWD